MNCKKGDLALIMRGASQGNIVRCLRRHDGPWGSSREFPGGAAPGWVIDRKLLQVSGLLSNKFLDSVLCPIRDPGEDATDEMVALLGKPASQPSKETA